MEPTTETKPATPTSPATPPAELKWHERPLVRKAIEIGTIVLLAWLAPKGIKLPGELPTQPLVVNVSYPVSHDAPAK